MTTKTLLLTFIFFLLSFNYSFAQEKYTILWVEKAKNPSFFEKGKELPALLINAARSKKITAYELPQNQALLQEMTAQRFQGNMKIPQTKGTLITEETEQVSLPENAQWLPQDMSLFAVYEPITGLRNIEFLALYAPYNDAKIFIAAFRFADVEKLFKKSDAALWQSPTQANFGNVLHLDIDDGSAYKVAKTLIMNEKESKIPISTEFKDKIEDESLSYEWLIRPVEKKVSKKEFQPTEIEVYNEGSELKLVSKFDFEKVKTAITEKEIYFLSYAEAIKQKLFVSDEQQTMPIPIRKEKAKNRFKKQLINDLNMKEEENKALFQQGNELVKYLIEAVQNRKITAYWSDSLATKLLFSELEAKLMMPPPPSISDSTTTANYLVIRQLYKLNLIEEMSFDQWGRQKNYQIKSIAILLPAQENTSKGIDEPLAYFSYKDIVKLLKKKKLKEMLSLFENRSFKAIPIFMKPTTRQ